MIRNFSGQLFFTQMLWKRYFKVCVVVENPEIHLPAYIVITNTKKAICTKIIMFEKVCERCVTVDRAL